MCRIYNFLDYSLMGNCTQCVQPQQQRRTSIASSTSIDNSSTNSSRRGLLSNRFRTIQQYNLNELIDQTLLVLRTVSENEQEPPHAMVIVSRIANSDDRWLEVMTALVDRIPINDPLGPTVIALLLDECFLPSRELLQQLIKRLCSENRTRVKQLKLIVEEYVTEERDLFHQTTKSNEEHEKIDNR